MLRAQRDKQRETCHVWIFCIVLRNANRGDLNLGYPSDLWVQLISRAVTRTIIWGGGVHVHIFAFCPTDFF